MIHDFLCRHRSDAFDDAARKITDDALGRIWRDRYRLLRAELTAVLGIINPFATELGGFAFPEFGHKADDRDRAIARLRPRVALLRQNLDDAVAAVFAVKGDPLDCAAELFLHLCFPAFACAYHDSMDWRMR